MNRRRRGKAFKFNIVDPEKWDGLFRVEMNKDDKNKDEAMSVIESFGAQKSKNGANEQTDNSHVLDEYKIGEEAKDNDDTEDEKNDTLNVPSSNRNKKVESDVGVEGTEEETAEFYVYE